METIGVTFHFGKQARDRKALVLLSEGDDVSNGTRWTPWTVRETCPRTAGQAMKWVEEQSHFLFAVFHRFSTGIMSQPDATQSGYIKT